MTEKQDSAGIRIPPPLIVLGMLLLGAAYDGRLTQWDAPSWPALVTGTTLIAAGLVIMISAVRRFGHAGTPKEPWLPSTALVTEGIYRRTRNPMYGGLLLIYSGLAMFIQSPAAAVLLIPLVLIFDRLIIPREEAFLRRRFGSAYEDYRSRVGRWF